MSKEVLLETLREIDARLDKNLSKYYVATNSFHQLRRMGNPCLIAIGLKGIGKTVAFQYLSEWEKESNIHLGVSTKNFRLELPHSTISHETVADQLKSNITFLLLDKIVNYANKNQSAVPQDLWQHANVLTTKLRKAGKEVLNRLKDFGGLSILGCGFQLNSKGQLEIARLIPKEDDSNAETLLQTIANSGLKIRLVFDDPDRVFFKSENTNANLVAGLCLAALQLSKLSKNLKVNILLKTNLYFEMMKIEEMKNLPFKVATYLAWTPKELQKLIARRLKHSKCIAEDIFAKDITKRDIVCDYLFTHSRNGPRDVVRWLEICLENDLHKKITPAWLQHKQKNYAERSADQMTVIYDAHYPDIKDFLQAYFSRHLKPHSKEQFHKNFLNLQVTSKESAFIFKNAWAKTPERALKALKEASCIAYKAGDVLILPYHAEYHDDEVIQDLPFIIIPAFKPLIGPTG